MSQQWNPRRSTLQIYAVVFLGVGAGLGSALGYLIGAVSDGYQADVTVIPRTSSQPKAFNWLFFEIGLAAGLVSCAILLAASVIVDRD